MNYTGEGRITKTKELALQNINQLYNFGYSLISKAKTKSRLDEAVELSRLYIKKIKAIKKHIKVKLPERVQKGYCKKCFVIFVPGKTATYRIKNKKKIIICSVCKNLSF